MSSPLTLTPSGPPTALARGGRSGAEDPFADGCLMARAGAALLLANVRYWATVAPRVRAQLSGWERRAGAIPDAVLRATARRKLREERFNVELAATLATLAGPARRGAAVQAIVALQVMYDYLDLLTERPLADPQRDGHSLFGALVDALAPEWAPGVDSEREPRDPAREPGDPAREPGDFEREPGGGYYPPTPCGPDRGRPEDGGYLRELVRAARLALGELPTTIAVAEVMRRSARRCAEAQVASHAAARAVASESGAARAELQRWARREAAGTALRWPELLAGATASVLAVHALVAAAASERTTRMEAEQIDAVYLSICALTMLDSLVDREDDAGTGALGYAQHYESHELMARRLAGVARDAAARARALPNAGHHVMTLVGVVAYYTSAPAAGSAFALPVSAHMRSELRPLIGPTLALMRAWRLAKRARRHVSLSFHHRAGLAESLIRTTGGRRVLQRLGD